MKQFVINKCYVELIKESLTSVISSKLTACGREVEKWAYWCGKRAMRHCWSNRHHVFHKFV